MEWSEYCLTLSVGIFIFEKKKTRKMLSLRNRTKNLIVQYVSTVLIEAVCLCYETYVIYQVVLNIYVFLNFYMSNQRQRGRHISSMFLDRLIMEQTLYANVNGVLMFGQ